MICLYLVLKFNTLYAKIKSRHVAIERQTSGLYVTWTYIYF